MLLDPHLMPVFVGAVFLLMIVPGPDMVFVTANALAGGTRTGLVSVLGVSTGAYVHIVFAAFGLTALFLASQVAYDAVRFVGAAYLAWIGLGILRSPNGLGGIGPAQKKPLFRVYRQGVLSNLSNPKAALFVISFVPQFVNPRIGPIWSQILAMGVIIVLVMYVVELPIVLFAGAFAAWLRRNERAGWYLNKLIGAFLMLMALYLFVSSKSAPARHHALPESGPARL